ncbi:MAG: glycosyltransferase family 4 protein [Anaerolineae bacterium]|nr:glycosyltransferase family 4 protein [Anaerolineae bacterium]
MRILHLIHQYLPEKVGGSELYTQALARYQVQEGHSVAIFTPAALPITDHQLPVTDDGLRIYRIPVGKRSPTAVFRSNFHQPELSQTFAQTLQQERPEIVHIQHLMGLPLSLVQAIQRAGLPYVITLHDYWYVCANAQLLTNFDESVCAGPHYWLNCAHCALARTGRQNFTPAIPFLAPLFAYRHGRLQSVLKKAHCLITPSHFTAHIYRQIGIPADHMEVIPYGIHTPTRPPVPLPHDDLHIGYIGGIASQKGVHVLIEAANRLPHNGVRVTIYGDQQTFPDYVAGLQMLASHPGITFAGRLLPENLWDALAELDVVVVPSLWYETAVLVVQEAFAAGVPVIASSIGVLPERVRDGVDGLLFPPGDAAALAAILRDLVEQPDKLLPLRAGIQPVVTIAENVARVTAVYEECVRVLK